MSHLTKYLDRVNFWRVNIDKAAPYTVSTLTEADAQVLVDNLQGELSPENLCCDGEISRSEVNARFRMFTGAMRELVQMFPNVRPEHDEYELFSQPIVNKKSFIVGSRVQVNHPSLGGRASGKIVKVNRVKCLVEFDTGKRYHVPMDLIETV